jgi:hypothetical protein
MRYLILECLALVITFSPFWFPDLVHKIYIALRHRP